MSLTNTGTDTCLKILTDANIDTVVKIYTDTHIANRYPYRCSVYLSVKVSLSVPHELAISFLADFDGPELSLPKLVFDLPK